MKFYSKLFFRVLLGLPPIITPEALNVQFARFGVTDDDTIRIMLTTKLRPMISTSRPEKLILRLLIIADALQTVCSTDLSLCRVVNVKNRVGKRC